MATCWAMTPPSETPRTSTVVNPSVSSSRTACRSPTPPPGAGSGRPGRTRWRPAVARSCRGPLMDITGGSGRERWMAPGAEAGGCGLGGAGSGLQPVEPVVPPGAGVFGGVAHPQFRVVVEVVGAGAVTGSGVARRVDQALDVPSGGGDEPGSTGEQTGAAVAGLPGDDVVGQRSEDVDVAVDLGQVDRGAAQGDPARFGEGVVGQAPDEVRVQAGRKVGQVCVPGQDVGGGW